MDTTLAQLPAETLRMAPAPAAGRLLHRLQAKLRRQFGKDPATATERDWMLAVALLARDRLVERRLGSGQRHGKEVCYLSMEFLPGRLLSDALDNLGLTTEMRTALAQAGVDLDRICAEEPDPALGNGGLGRLAACFMESMASLGIPAFGYGIRYEHGLFRQHIRGGVQQELPEDWLAAGDPWSIERGDIAYPVGFGGSVQDSRDADGRLRQAWQPEETVLAVARDTPVVGQGAQHVNALRLWSARATEPLELQAFNAGDHLGAQAQRLRAEAITRVLYPGDGTPAGQELRLRQEYFFASASLQDMLRRHLSRAGDLRSLPRHVAVQLNDTHPAIAVAELLRLLVDQHGLGWEEAWGVTRGVFAYTNHTLLPEALESWPVALMERLLPRHLQIIYALNQQHLDAVRAQEGADDRLVAAVSLIDENHGRRVRMGHLAFLGAHSVNGVSALHSALMRRTVFADLDRVLPGRIVNRTNGISLRRWLHRANPGLTGLLREALGERVLRAPETLGELAALAGDAGFLERFRAQRMAAKRNLADLVADRVEVAVDPTAIFDVQIKRIHEYKRQLLNLLHAVALWQEGPRQDRPSRVKILAGKAAPGYHRAKQIIRLAHDIARVVNADARARDRLKLAFLPDYNVSLAEMIVPAADLSEQISTAGMEASGTGNMKLALNGAITIGTLDGANVEIREHVGDENIVIFGLTAEEVQARRGTPGAVPPVLNAVLDAIAGGAFSPEEPDRYRDLVQELRGDDRFMVLADFDAYCAAQDAVEARWRQPEAWWRSAVLNTARMGWFSADRTIAEYAAGTWGVAVNRPA